MGSQNEGTFLTKAQAGARLNVTARSVSTYIRQGFLRPVKRGNHVGVLEEDVLALLATWSSSKSRIPLNSETVERFHAELRTLRREMDTVLRILNVRREPLSLTGPELVALYKTASSYSHQGWPPQAEEAWADYLLKLRPQHFSQIEKITNDKHPWRPFLRLAATMHVQPYNQELLLQLSSARDHLLEMAHIWFDMKSISLRALDRMVREDTKPSKVLLRRLSKAQDAKAQPSPG